MRKTVVLVAGAYSEEDKFTSFYDTDLIGEYTSVWRTRLDSWSGILPDIDYGFQ